MKNTDEAAGRLTAINDRLETLADELARVPAWQVGSPWHMERVNERQALLRERDELRCAANRLPFTMAVARKAIPRFEKW